MPTTLEHQTASGASGSEFNTPNRRTYEYRVVGGTETTYVHPISLAQYREDIEQELAAAELGRDEGYWRPGSSSWEDDVSTYKDALAAIDRGDVRIDKVDATDSLNDRELNERLLSDETFNPWRVIPRP